MRQKFFSRRLLLLIPALALMAAALLLPLANALVQSISTPELGPDNYIRLFTDGATIDIVLRTVAVALSVTVLTALLGYPYAYFMTRTNSGWRLVLSLIVLVPFWTSMMARNFAWMGILQRNGPVDSVATFVTGEGLVLLGTIVGVTIAMTQVMLPFMVLPLYSNLAGINRNLLTAAQSLGSSPTRAFWKTYFPLSVPGIISGGILVFAMSFGFYVTPALLGSPQEALVAQLMGQRVLDVLDFGGASALGLVVLALTLVLIAFADKLGGSVGAIGSSVSKKGGVQ